MSPKCPKCGGNNFLLQEIKAEVVGGKEADIENDEDDSHFKVLFCADCGGIIQALPKSLFDLPRMAYCLATEDTAQEIRDIVSGADN